MSVLEEKPLKKENHSWKRTSKMINDPIHGHVSVPEHVVQIVDTPQFQRLRDLSQLGTTYYVFPGASHNRFEHCIGVSHLAGKLLRQIHKSQPELLLSQKEMRLVTIAGLCHDLGHGPFSHAFEEWIERVRPQSNWHHEEMSKKMLQYLIDDNNIDYEKEDIRLIQDLIGGVSPPSFEKKFLFDVVANMRNSVDVDKFDYLARDCYNVGIKSSYDYSRLLKFSRVINNEICFHSKEVYNVYEMFHTRYSMHKQVYSHKVGKAIEYMISDALTLADQHLNISSSIDDPESYCYLTDSIIKTIEASKIPELEPSRAIIKNIRRRNLYKFADEVLISPEICDQVFTKIKETDIVGFGSNLKEEDIIINFVTMNYAMKDKNPVDSVHFFNKWDQEESFSIPRQNVSLLIPEHFSEKYIRIFVRDPSKAFSVQEAFRTFLHKKMNYSSSSEHLVPSRIQ